MSDCDFRVFDNKTAAARHAKALRDQGFTVIARGPMTTVSLGETLAGAAADVKIYAGSDFFTVHAFK